MSRRSEPASPFTAPERDLIRRELCMHFSQSPSLADGLFLRTWRGGSQKGQPKIPPAVQSMAERGEPASSPSSWAKAKKAKERNCSYWFGNVGVAPWVRINDAEAGELALAFGRSLPILTATRPQPAKLSCVPGDRRSHAKRHFT